MLLAGFRYNKRTHVMKNFIKKIIYSPAIRKSGAPALRMLLRAAKKDYIIMCMDGGICSQMHFYVIGKHFEEQGFRVAYNMQWYRVSGMDLDGRFVRNFDLLKLHPKLAFKTVENRMLLILYRMFFMSRYVFDDDKDASCTWRNEVAPAYFPGYFRDVPELFAAIMPKCFPFEVLSGSLDDDSIALRKRIMEKECVAMHVRRGDLSRYTEEYGAPCSTAYFLRAVRFFAERGVTRFFLFSDEPQWCRENLLPSLPAGNEYVIADGNGSDKGYMDLVLMASCSHTIASKGSLGKYSACLNNSADRLVVCCDDMKERFWEKVFRNVIFLSNEEG